MLDILSVSDLGLAFGLGRCGYLLIGRLGRCLFRCEALASGIDSSDLPCTDDLLVDPPAAFGDPSRLTGPTAKVVESLARLTAPRDATSSFSILGECTGKVRSTPTPNDCFLTVKVSREPEPWRLITTPSNTWGRLRLPSMTRK